MYTFDLSYIFNILAKHFCSCDERRDGTVFLSAICSTEVQVVHIHNVITQKKNVRNGDALSFNCTEMLLHVLL